MLMSCCLSESCPDFRICVFFHSEIYHFYLFVGQSDSRCLSSSFAENDSWSGGRRLSTGNPEGEEVIRRTDSPCQRHRVQMKTETQTCVNMHTWPRREDAAVKSDHMETDSRWAAPLWALMAGVRTSWPAVYLMYCTTWCTVWTPGSGLGTRDSH